jgi:hypothetical protein
LIRACRPGDHNRLLVNGEIKKVFYIVCKQKLLSLLLWENNLRKELMAYPGANTNPLTVGMQFFSCSPEELVHVCLREMEGFRRAADERNNGVILYFLD